MIKELQEKIKTEYAHEVKNISRHKLMTMIMGNVGEMAQCVFTGDTKTYDHSFGAVVNHTVALAIKMGIDVDEIVKQELEKDEE